jgi:hypothetical protein
MQNEENTDAMSRCQGDNLKRDFANERDKKRKGEDREEIRLASVDHAQFQTL